MACTSKPSMTRQIMQSVKTWMCSGPMRLLSSSSPMSIFFCASAISDFVIQNPRSILACRRKGRQFRRFPRGIMRHSVRVWSIGLLLVVALLVAVPASAQIDLSGEWAPVRAEDNTGNPELGDWVGIPMNDASRLRSSAWDASIYTLPEWQCRPHGSAYISRGPSQLKIWKEADPVSRETTAWHMEWLRSVDRPVYMDGRPHPSPNALHTWAGFSTGEWIGDTLRIRVTHLKEEYQRRNGVFHSDEIEVTQYLIRRGNYLTFLVIAYDPVYLTEPLIRSTEYQLALNQQ